MEHQQSSSHITDMDKYSKANKQIGVGSFTWMFQLDLHRLIKLKRTVIVEAIILLDRMESSGINLFMVFKFLQFFRHAGKTDGQFTQSHGTEWSKLLE